MIVAAAVSSVTSSCICSNRAELPTIYLFHWEQLVLRCGCELVSSAAGMLGGKLVSLTVAAHLLVYAQLSLHMESTSLLAVFWNTVPSPH